MRFLTQGKTNWKYIIIVLVVAIIIGGGIFVWQHLCFQKEIAELPRTKTPEEQEAKWTGSRMVRVQRKIEENGKGKIIFSTIEGKTIAEVSDRWFLLGKSEKWERYWIVGYYDAIETSPDIFYIFLIDGKEGSNTTYTLFKCNIKEQQIAPVQSELDEEGPLGYFSIFGNIADYYFSPDKRKVAVEFIVSAGAWNFHEDINVIFFEESERYQYYSVYSAAVNQEITKQIIPESDWNRGGGVLWMNFLNWLNNDCFKLCLTAGSWGNSEIPGGLYKYCVSTEELELIDNNIPEQCLNDIPEQYRNIDMRACLAGETNITMTDGNYKRIENIKKGDVVRTFNIETKEYRGSKVVEVIRRKDPIININGILKTAPDELIYLADGSIKQAVNVEIGDYLLGEEEYRVEVVSINYSKNRIATYDLRIENGENFFANGFLVHTPKEY